jgi:indolepyruvate ferredoxin oxidoreductase alpha subunit
LKGENSMKELLTGNEAIARGIYEAGAGFGSAYPGTPSTEIFDTLPIYSKDVYSEWAPNEKVATEVAYGASIAGLRSVTAMKHVGLNVAADLVFSAAYLGVGKGFVIISADDPDMHSSQNEQDNRLYARFAKIPCIEPSDSQECIDFMKEAFDISEKFDVPVLFRVTTRICHSKSLVTFGERINIEPFEYKKHPTKFNAMPSNARLNHIKLEGNLKALSTYGMTSALNKTEMKGSKIGVVTASIAYQYAKEVFPEDTSFLKLGLTFPLPMDLIRDFASKVETLYVIEELEPFMEEQIKAAGIACIGKEKIPNIFELNPEIVAGAIFNVVPDIHPVAAEIVGRPPALCPGCPHRGFFYTLSKNKEYVITSDIGCYTLGSLPPLSATDTTVCMGGGFSIGMGMAKAFERMGKTDKKIFGVVGDSTFFHSGMTGAAEIIYNKGRVIPCVLDNRITAMTGHQENPGSGYALSKETADIIPIEGVLKALGFQNVFVVDPTDLGAMDKAVKDALASEVPAAIVTKSPCVLIKRLELEKHPCAVNPDVCRSCRKCLKVGCPALSFDTKSHIDPALCTGCEVCAQVCPFGAISMGGKK